MSSSTLTIVADGEPLPCQEPPNAAVDGFFRVVAYVGAIRAFSFPVHGYTRMDEGNASAGCEAFNLTSSFASRPRPLDEHPLALLIDPMSLAALGGEAPLSLAVGSARTERPLRVKGTARKLFFDLGNGEWVEEDAAALAAVLEPSLLLAGAAIIADQNLPEDDQVAAAPAHLEAIAA